MCKKILSNQCMQRKIGADKGGLISEGIFSIFVPSSKKGAKSISSTFQTNVKKKVEASDFAHFFEDLTKVKEIKQTLLIWVMYQCQNIYRF